MLTYGVYWTFELSDSNMIAHEILFTQLVWTHIIFWLTDYSVSVFGYVGKQQHQS